MSNAVPSTASVLLTLVGVTWRRFLRGRAVWVAFVIATLPMIMASVVHDLEAILLVQTLVMGLLPPVFVASAVGEEIEDRTSTYLWSRPVARWTLLVGKLLAFAPVAMVLIAVGWVLAILVSTGKPPSLQSIIAFAAGGLVISAMSAGIGTLVPRHGMALSIVYLVVIDLTVGAIPASVRSLSITHQVHVLSGLSEPSAVLEPAITMVILAAVWLTIGLVRLRRLES